MECMEVAGQWRAAQVPLTRMHMHMCLQREGDLVLIPPGCSSLARLHQCLLARVW